MAFFFNIEKLYFVLTNTVQHSISQFHFGNFVLYMNNLLAALFFFKMTFHLNLSTNHKHIF